ncbi:MAG: S8 family serine peptidase [Halofilum sp. (in: g-proteobacteria)]
MAELVHDIAPVAGITFHTAVAGGIAGVADAIDRLCASGSGVDVVVDDIGFFAELMYQRDPISRAAEACVARGVPFFSAAGNSGRRGLRETFDDLQAFIDDEGRPSVFPVIAATDGNNTSFLGTPWADTDLASEAGEDDGAANFFGTSAAAPNAAAVAALLLDNDGTLEPAEIGGKLQTSAVDVTGRNAGMGCDDVTGSGLVDAAAALLAADAAPQADAGRDISVDTGDTVTLDGGGSSDNRFVENYRWRQVGGRRVQLSNPGGARTRFDAPRTGSTLVFELRVVDAACLSDADRVTVQVGDGGGDSDDGAGSGGGGNGPGLMLLVALLAAGNRMRRVILR